MRILLVEDELDLANLIAFGLRRAGFAVDMASTAASALVMVEITRYDALVLDRGLPDMSGDEICRELSSTELRPGVLMLSAAGEVDDRVAGLSIGADDYLPKPFAMSELVARLRALGRRPATQSSPVLLWSDLEVDTGRHRAVRAAKLITLSRKEFAVLEVLMIANGAPISAEELLERVWDDQIDPFTNVVRMTLMNLRRKLGDPVLIETITGIGYRMCETR